MFEIRIVTADRQQVRRKRGAPEYDGPQWLNSTLDSILASDIPLTRISIYNDTQGFKQDEQSVEHTAVLNKARALGIRVVQNKGCGYNSNFTEALAEPLRFDDTKYIIFFEDDIEVYKEILKETTAWINSIENLQFGLLFSFYDTPTVDPENFSCTQGVVFNVKVVQELVHACKNYEEVISKPYNIPYDIYEVFDIRLGKCIHHLFKVPLYNCTPSLVQHVGGLASSWGLPDHPDGGIRNTQHFKK